MSTLFHAYGVFNLRFVDCSIIISALRAFWFRGSLPGCFSRSFRILSNNTLAGSSFGPFNAIPVLSNDRHCPFSVQFDNDFILGNPKGCNYYSKEPLALLQPRRGGIIQSPASTLFHPCGVFNLRFDVRSTIISALRALLSGCFSRSFRILSNNTLAGSSIGHFNAISVLF